MVGRPTKHESSCCGKVVSLMAKGLSKDAVAGRLGISRDTLYEWCNTHQEFSDSIKTGEAKSRYYWEKIGMDLFTTKHEEEAGKLNKSLRHLQTQYSAKREELKEFVKMRARKELTQEEFMDQKSDILIELKDLEERTKDNNYSANSWLELCTKFLNNAFSALETMTKGKPQEKRDLILDVGQNLVLRDGKLQFSFKQPYDILLSPKYRQDMLPD